jgi:hypothetical protein
LPGSGFLSTPEPGTENASIAIIAGKKPGFEPEMRVKCALICTFFAPKQP